MFCTWDLLIPFFVTYVGIIDWIIVQNPKTMALHVYNLIRDFDNFYWFELNSDLIQMCHQKECSINMILEKSHDYYFFLYCNFYFSYEEQKL